MSLAETQVAAVRDLSQAWPNRKIVVIGATALGFYFDMRWRKTADVAASHRHPQDGLVL